MVNKTAREITGIISSSASFHENLILFLEKIKPVNKIADETKIIPIKYALSLTASIHGVSGKEIRHNTEIFQISRLTAIPITA